MDSLLFGLGVVFTIVTVLMALLPLLETWTL